MSAHPLLAFTRQITREMPRQVAAAGALSLLLTAAEAAGVLLLIPLLTIAGIPTGRGVAGSVARAVERGFLAIGVQPGAGAVLLLFVAVTLVQAVVRRAEALVGHRMQFGVSHRMRTRLYAALAEARWLPLARMRGADLLNGLTTESDRVGSAAGFVVAFVVNMLLALAYITLALRVSAPVTGVAMVTGAILMAVLRPLRRASRSAGQGLTAATATVAAAATEHLGALKVVKSYGAEERNARHFGAAATLAMEMGLRGWRAYADAGAVFLAGSAVLLAVVAYAALELLNVTGGTVLLLIFVFYRLVPRLSQLQTVYQMIARDIPAWEALAARIEALEAEREGLQPPDGTVRLAETVRFEDVSFTYEPGVPDVVAGLDLDIQAFRTTALVGPSGSGKTTVADLMMGLVTPRLGRITVDGRPLQASWLRGWRDEIGYVAQETVLFNETVLANLRWARPDATEEEVWEALRLAAADRFVAALPDGLETTVGDRGVRLSGGERQRLALARALLRRPALLILDEATSALDTENERRIRDAIRALHGRTTILLITHRLPSVRDADVIHVMEAGRRVESGSFDELMARAGGRFRRLWASQSGADPDDPPE
jgi:ATP-binding cassette subfamily C protein